MTGREAAQPAARVAVTAPGRATLAGDLTFDSVASLWDEVATVLAAADGGRVLLDLSGVTRADSAGLALLVGWMARAQAAGVTLGLAAMPARLGAIARISEVDGLLGVPAA